MIFLATAWSFLRNSWIGKVTLFVGGALLFTLLVFTAGGRAKLQKLKIKNLENYVDVQKRVDASLEEAKHSVGAMSDGDLDDRLRRHPGAFRE